MREVPPLAGALAGRCPRCKSKTLFAGWVRFADRCRACDLDFSSFNVGDGPAAFLILIIGAILTAAALAADGMLLPPWWAHLIWVPIGVAMTIVGLRLAKALLLTQEYVHRAREGRIGK
ncbi:MAG TPA: DUF983 domain-containing protein [Sphingomicrobium sp.]|nr:DUF983 domain-containing protein [Sphingomicrobium sp.]